jgi:hypothetical protein
MGGGASFDANQARRQLHKKRQNTTRFNCFLITTLPAASMP